MWQMSRVPAPGCLVSKAPQWTASWVAGGNWSWHDQACKNNILQALKASTDDRCSYCSAAPFTAEIDHFFPKTAFRKLAYEWTNLYAACPGCNKGKGVVQPSPEVLRPDEAGYSFYEFFVVDVEGTLRPSPACDDQAERRALATIELFKLNRAELVGYRRRGLGQNLQPFPW
jgi:uncharacterized protein (TIGR02646 family)